jgi:predicted short-subunit dehydrogenase-like oxidoreductase (DUF2520 family)
MAGKPRIAIVGAGNLGAALARALRRAEYSLDEIISRSNPLSLRGARRLARGVGAMGVDLAHAQVRAEVVWFCVPDAQIAHAAESLASRAGWQEKIALHSSGALTSDALGVLRQRGAAVASVHPLMTFVPKSRPSLAAVSFAIEGDARAVRAARQIVKQLGGQAFSIHKKNKAAYHAWATFASPLLTALLAVTERIGVAAGVNAKTARSRMLPILAQTLANYAALGAAGSFSGPIVRGDVDTVNAHLRTLRKIPEAREIYLALARSALRNLPAGNRRSLRKILGAEYKAEATKPKPQSTERR